MLLINLKMASISKGSSHIANHVPYFCLLKATNSTRFIKLSFFVIVVYFSFNTHKVEIVIKKYIHMHLNILDLKIKIFCDLRVFVLSSIPKYENPGIVEMLQKRYNTEIRKCTFKNSSNALQITSTSK